MREEGYYFVKYYSDNIWTIARYDGEDYGFLVIGNDWHTAEESIQEIGDKIELPKD